MRARGSKEAGPDAGEVCVRLPAKPMNSVFVRKPRAGKKKKDGPAAGEVCVRLPAKPMNSVFVRKPRAGKKKKDGPAAGGVCVRLPAKPIKSVFVRKPRSRKRRKGGPGAGAVCVRLPAKSINSVFVRNPGPGKRKKPARGPSDSPVLGALLSAYREVTGDDSRPISIGGGTYAKAMPNMVAFGPNFPGHENREHMEDEYILVEDFLKLEEIYERALAYLLDSSDAASSSARIDSAFA